MTRFNDHQIWPHVKPPYLAVKTHAKMDGVSDKKHKFGIMHGRDPMRAAIPMMGHYFAFDFLHEQADLPSLETWKGRDEYHSLVHAKSGKETKVAEYNEYLDEELEAIGAKHLKFSLYGWRNQRLKQSGEDPKMETMAMVIGSGHSTGCHVNNYDGYTCAVSHTVPCAASHSVLYGQSLTLHRPVRAFAAA